MKKLSIQLLSDVILEKRKNRNISQEQLSKLTGNISGSSNGDIVSFGISR